MMLSLSFGLVLAACATTSVDTTSTSMDGHDHEHGVDDQSREWELETVPELAIDIAPNENGSFLLTIDAPGFTFTGADVFDPVPGEGHAHLYIDGELYSMVYGPEFVIPALDSGTHEVMVALSTNDHLDYTVDGELIMAMTSIDGSEETVAVPTTEAVDHEMSHIMIDVSNGEVTGADATVPVDLGSHIVLRVTSDIDEIVHVHGYDLFLEVVAGQAADLAFIADVPGVFEIEFEESGLLLIELQVS